MRLIDADALKEMLGLSDNCKTCKIGASKNCQLETFGVYDICTMLDDAPTVTPEPVEPIASGQDDWACGNCGGTVGWNELSCSGQDAVKHNYCPSCGKAVKWE